MFGRMKNKQILITINNLDEIKELKELGITNYAYPLKGFCVGMPNTFLVSEIIDDGYLFINRILDNKGIDELKNILYNLPSTIKGIIFDDLGIMEIVKDLNIEKILYLSHFNTNSKSVNIFSSLVDSVILSTDITEQEIEYIINHSEKEVSLFVFGYVGVMYSRRKLITNYNNFYHLNSPNVLDIENTEHLFKVHENEYGTYFYYDKVFNGLNLMNLKAKYYFINSAFLTITDIKKALNGESEETDRGFLDKETIYKLKGE